MSEYQYYGFQAIDRPLSEDDMRWLRGLSTRAQITTTSFVNTYHRGDFRGDPIKLMERCFDAFVYVTNRGYRRFMVRLSRAPFDAACAKPYCQEVNIGGRAGEIPRPVAPAHAITCPQRRYGHAARRIRVVGRIHRCAGTVTHGHVPNAGRLQMSRHMILPYSTLIKRDSCFLAVSNLLQRQDA